MFNDNIDITRRADRTLREDSWNTTSNPAEEPYNHSKVEAERAAWRIHDAQSPQRWDMVAVCPSMVIGPALSPESRSGSLFMLDELLRGVNWYGAAPFYIPYVDVRDVALAHVRAGEESSASGRYIVATEQASSLREVANMVRPVHLHPLLLPRSDVPKVLVWLFGPMFGLPRVWVGKNAGLGYSVDNSRSKKELGIRYRPVEEAVREHYQAWLKPR